MFEDCINCKDRFLGCHDVCELYLKDKKLNEEIKKKKMLENILNHSSFISHQRNRYIKIR